MVELMSSKTLSTSHYDPEIPVTRAQEVLTRLRRRSERRRSVWNGHVAGFVAINAFLAFLDLVTGGGLWFPYVTGAMTIPFVSHAVFKWRRNRLQEKLERELEERPGLPDRLFRPFRKLHRSVTHFMMGTATAGTISAYLFLINIMTGGSFWSIIPVASLALPVVFHGLILRGRQNSLRRVIAAGGDSKGEERPRKVRRAERDGLPGPVTESGGAGDDATRDGPEQALVREARRLEEQIAARRDLSAPDHAELLGGVRELTSEIERLGELLSEFRAVANQISLDELEADRSILSRRRSEESDGPLLHDYDDALEQISRQIESYRELERREELLEVRLRAGVNALRQIQVDIVRTQGDAALGDINRRVRSRTEELSAYLDDLSRSYQELRQELGE